MNAKETMAQNKRTHTTGQNRKGHTAVGKRMVFDDSKTAAHTDPSTLWGASGLPRALASGPAAAKSSLRQKTLKSSISCTGTGLHSGRRVSMALHPAPVGSGIVFRVPTPGGGTTDIPALWSHVRDSRQCTLLGMENGAIVGTVEHLLSALAGLRLTNVLIEMDGPEVPVMDGSAAPFAFLIDCAGVVEQDAAAQVLRVLKPVSVTHNGQDASLSPALPGETDLHVSFEIEFKAAAIGRQAISQKVTPALFRSSIMRARTFGMAEDVPKMRAAGLALGGSLDNAVVVDGAKILNDEGLRYRDEFVRHKVLDAVGDLALAGAPIVGRYHGYKASHALNTALVAALMADPSAWTLGPLQNQAADPSLTRLRVSA